ncbi:MAG: Unknown protein [uncultured Sulfurovum sp.]|uniref:Uncharacterized protein n=1 Tax=uncultured Sulfurovum sp. TaxID=269237 RepID=A0A6S6SWS8_9BACT|nr:MAG: Unknown protein [uncultured Sulfurovum sp.]
MKRRYKALIAIIVPLIIMGILSYVHPISYNYIMGYMVAVVLVFKSSILSLWLVSKLKLLHFLKGLTLFQALLLGMKRWLIDNIVSQWLDKHIISHFKKPFQELFQYYKAISFKTKIKNFVVIVLPLGLGVWVMYITDLLTHIALFVELKVIVIGFFKALWLILSKIFLWLTSSWFAPILEVFALSYLLTLLEKFLGKNNPISRFFNYIGNKLNDFLAFLGVLNDKHIEPILNKNISKRSQSFGHRISQIIRNKKIKDEYLYFDNFQNIILKGHINAYHSFKKMEAINNKKELYNIINQETSDNINIIAYVSRNGKGDLLEEKIINDYYHDIFMLKGIASHKNHGVRVQNEEEIDHTDFWVLNTSKYPVWIKSTSKNIKNYELKANEMKLIKTNNHVNFNSQDLYFEYNMVQISPTALDQSN